MHVGRNPCSTHVSDEILFLEQGPRERCFFYLHNTVMWRLFQRICAEVEIKTLFDRKDEERVCTSRRQDWQCW